MEENDVRWIRISVYKKLGDEVGWGGEDKKVGTLEMQGEKSLNSDYAILERPCFH